MAWGIRLPYQYPVVSVGLYQMSEFESGLSLYQTGKQGPYYSLSPLNDYIVDTTGNRMPLLSGGEFVNGEYEWVKGGGKLGEIEKVIQAYLGTSGPSYEMVKDGLRVKYETRIEGNEVEVVRRQLWEKARRWSGQGMTLRFGVDDVVFDPVSLAVYSWSQESELDFLEAFLGRRLMQVEGLTNYQLLPRNSVAIVNPNLASILVVEIPEGNRLAVDREYHLIESVEQRQELGQESESWLKIRAVNNWEEIGK